MFDFSLVESLVFFVGQLLLLTATIVGCPSYKTKDSGVSLVEQMTKKPPKAIKTAQPTTESTVTKSAKLPVRRLPNNKFGSELPKPKSGSLEQTADLGRSVYAYEVNGKRHHVDLTANRPHVTRSGIV